MDLSGFSINYVAVFVAAIAAWIVGYLWYTVIFVGMWRKLMGVTPEMVAAHKAQGKSMMPMMVIYFLSAFVMADVMAYNVWIWKAGDFMMALQVAFWLWLGFSMTTRLDQAVMDMDKNKNGWKLFALDSGYRLVAMIVCAAVLAMWK
ncbi:MAG: hypothetical protein RLZZ324_907 [Candidatus Parcubacteria bacterium]|jgi:hypothetical protein